MKELIITAATLMIAFSAYGQGQFLFNTHDLSVGNNVRFTLGGEPATGADLFVEIFVGVDLSHLTPLSPLLPLNRTGAGAGYTNPFGQIYEVPGSPAGTTAVISYRAFKGSSLANATLVSGITLEPVVLTEPPTPPNEVSLGNQVVPIDIPEAAPWALGLLGLGAVLVLRPGKHAQRVV